MEDFVYIKVFITAEVCSETAELLMISCHFYEKFAGQLLHRTSLDNFYNFKTT